MHTRCGHFRSCLQYLHSQASRKRQYWLSLFCQFSFTFQTFRYLFPLSLLAKDVPMVKSKNHFSVLTYLIFYLAFITPLSPDFIPIPWTKSFSIPFHLCISQFSSSMHIVNVDVSKVPVLYLSGSIYSILISPTASIITYT